MNNIWKILIPESFQYFSYPLGPLSVFSFIIEHYSKEINIDFKKIVFIFGLTYVISMFWELWSVWKKEENNVK
jgi:hypothetical protein